MGKSAGIRVYAEGTTVPTDQSRREIETYLEKRGATRIFFMSEPNQFVLGFVYEHLLIRFNVPVPAEGRGPSAASVAKIKRERMRAMLLSIKARFASIDSGISSFEREFMPNVVTPSGQTVAEWLQPQLRISLESGEMPKMLPFLGKDT
jgi:hypothetical protein